MEIKSTLSIISGIVAFLLSALSFVMVQMSFLNIPENLEMNIGFNSVIWGILASVFGVIGSSLLHRKMSLLLVLVVCFLICGIASLIGGVATFIFSLLGVGLALSLIVAFLVRLLHKDDQVAPTDVFLNGSKKNEGE